MKLTKRQPGSSCRKVTTCAILLALMATVSCPNATVCPEAAPASALTIVCPRASSLSSIPKALAFDGSGAPDLLLQQHHAVEQRFRRRRADGPVDVHRHH